MVDNFLGKKYKLHSSDNFDEFMKALGQYTINAVICVYKALITILITNVMIIIVYKYCTFIFGTFIGHLIRYKNGENFFFESVLSYISLCNGNIKKKMDNFFGKKYVLNQSENFDAYMKKLGE